MKVDGIQSGFVYVSAKNDVKEQGSISSVEGAFSTDDSLASSLSKVANRGSSVVSTDKQLSKEKSIEVLEQANAILKLSNSDIEFKLDDSSGKLVFYIKDADSGDVLRQIPNESMLRLSENITQFLEGVSELSGSSSQRVVLSGLLTDTKV